MDSLIIYVKDFSIVPGTRKRDEGKNAHSGEEFREDFLIPLFREAMKDNKKLIVNLDGTIGYGTSWLEEVFGGLARQFGKTSVQATLDFISDEEPYLIEDIIHYIDHAEKNN
jgi:hypothetical protein